MPSAFTEWDGLYRARTDGSFVEQIPFPGDDLYFGDISFDGSRIVFGSSEDPDGQNPEGNREIFLYDVDTGAIVQLTQTSSGSSDTRTPLLELIQ